MLVIWNERASPFLERAGAGKRVMSSPANRMRPESGCSIPESWLISVVLPAPFGPITACVSPSRTSRSTPSVACRAPKALRSPRISSSGSAIVFLPRKQAGKTALREQHHQHQNRPEDDLPVLGKRGKNVFKDQQREGPEQRPGR